jgi:uncharacterized membrane protein
MRVKSMTSFRYAIASTGIIKVLILLVWERQSLARKGAKKLKLKDKTALVPESILEVKQRSSKVRQSVPNRTKRG